MKVSVLPRPVWRRSSYCEGGQCVEVGFSSASQTGGTCVEVSRCACPQGDVLVRDSKDPTGPVLSFTQAEWAAFVAGAKAGEFDPPA